MTTTDEREQILNEYGAWTEQKTLDGLDLSVEAYLSEVRVKEDVHLLDIAQGVIGKAFRLDFSPEGFRGWLYTAAKEGAACERD